MASLVDVIGLISGVLGIWSFGETLLPAQDVTASMYRIQVGLDDTPGDGGDKLSNAGGGIDKIRTYNANGALLGAGGATTIGSGSFSDVGVAQGVSNQAITAEFYATSDAPCIAYISATLHDGTKWGWTGDWGKICGLPWYYSGIAVSRLLYKIALFYISDINVAIYTLD